MGNFTFIKTEIKDLVVVEQRLHGDDRGFFMETYNENDFRAYGITELFVQDNHSRSKKGVLRGLHFQKHYPQGKLVRVIEGEIFDVAVDIRIESSTFGKWFGLTLSSENKKQLYIPGGFAHGFLVLSEHAEVVYKCTDFYHPHDEQGIAWNDMELCINWPRHLVSDIHLSEKDKKWSSWRTFVQNLG